MMCEHRPGALPRDCVVCLRIVVKASQALTAKTARERDAAKAEAAPLRVALSNIEGMASRLWQGSGGYSQQMAGHIKAACAKALSSDAGKGCEHEFTGPPGAYPYEWSRCLLCKMIVKRPAGKGWVPPEWWKDKLFRHIHNQAMNACDPRCGACALEALEVE